MQVERDRWETLLAQAGAWQGEQPSASGDWSLKDIIAHVTAYERGLVRWLEAASRGELIVFPVLDQPDVDRRNAVIQRQSRDRAMKEVRQEAGETFSRLLQLVSALPEEDLVEPERTEWYVVPRWSESRPLWKCIADDSYGHYHQHIPTIRRWL